MRHFINLVEGLVPQVDREAIVSHMIDSLLARDYWDRDARTPEGQPMDSHDVDDIASELASRYGEKITYGDASYTTTSGFREKLTRWANARFDEVMEKLAEIQLVDGLIRVHRMIKVVPTGWEPTGRPLGIYWCFDIDNADFESPWARDNEGDDVVLHGLVAPRDVDWPITILANMDWMHGDREHEIRVRKGAPIKLLDIDGDTRVAGIYPA